MREPRRVDVVDEAAEAADEALVLDAAHPRADRIPGGGFLLGLLGLEDLGHSAPFPFPTTPSRYDSTAL